MTTPAKKTTRKVAARKAASTTAKKTAVRKAAAKKAAKTVAKKTAVRKTAAKKAAKTVAKKTAVRKAAAKKAAQDRREEDRGPQGGGEEGRQDHREEDDRAQDGGQEDDRHPVGESGEEDDRTQDRGQEDDRHPVGESGEEDDRTQDDRTQDDRTHDDCTQDGGQGARQAHRGEEDRSEARTLTSHRVAGVPLDFAALRTELAVAGDFTSEVLADAERAAATVELPDEDATDLPLVTVDPTGSRDLDQALHIAVEGDGYLVSYAIADVAAFVTPDSPVDRTAHARVETLYFPDLRVPLHPPVVERERREPVARPGPTGGVVAHHARRPG